MEKREIKFSSLSDAVCLIKKISESLSEDDPYYEDFRFFSAINCTTQSEYRQDLKTFLGQLLDTAVVVEKCEHQQDFSEDLKNLYDWL